MISLDPLERGQGGLMKCSRDLRKRITRRAAALLGTLILGIIFSGCAAGSSAHGNVARRLNDLAARNQELEKRVGELEQKLALMESVMNGGAVRSPSGTTGSGTQNLNVQPGMPAPLSGATQPTIPHPPGLTVVKIRPPSASGVNQSAATPPSGQNQDQPPPLFSDEPGFDEPTSPGAASDSQPEEPSHKTPNANPAPSGSPAGLPVEAVTLYESAVGQFHKGEYELAVEAFMLYTTRYPGTMYEPSALFYMGECKFKLGQYAGAIEQFRRYLMKFPGGNEAPIALLRMGMSYMRMEDKESARKAFKQVIERFPDSPAATAARQELENIP